MFELEHIKRLHCRGGKQKLSRVLQIQVDIISVRVVRFKDLRSTKF